MAEVTQYSFPFKEVVELLVKKQGIKEGRWALSFEIGVAVGLMGPNPDEAKPSAMMQINAVQISRVPDDQPLSTNAVDASLLQVMPAPSVAKSPARGRKAQLR